MKGLLDTILHTFPLKIFKMDGKYSKLRFVFSNKQLPEMPSGNVKLF
jgi:hypothetical protein